MSTEKQQNFKLGIFIVIGTIFLIIAFYLIGSQRNLFGSSFKVSARFYNVNGLMSGNNVRFAGIDVGTVEEVEILNDSVVNVVMIIEESATKFIKKNAIASVGTDGLMGNKLVNINASPLESSPIESGDILQTLRPIETDEMIRTLNTTNENIKAITTDLKKITQKINNSNTLWSLLLDTVIAENVKNAIVNIKMTSYNSAVITGDLSAIIQNVKDGKGSVGALLSDTSFAQRLQQSIVNVQLVTDKMAVVTGDLQFISSKIKKGEGAIGTLIMDTTFVQNLNQSLENVKTGSAGFSENMEALKHNVFLRKYYQKKEKKTK